MSKQRVSPPKTLIQSDNNRGIKTTWYSRLISKNIQYLYNYSESRAGGSLWEETLYFKAATLTIWVTSTQKHTYKNRASTFYTSAAACSDHTQTAASKPTEGETPRRPALWRSEVKRVGVTWSLTERGGDCCQRGAFLDVKDWASFTLSCSFLPPVSCLLIFKSAGLSLVTWSWCFRRN